LIHFYKRVNKLYFLEEKKNKKKDKVLKKEIKKRRKHLSFVNYSTE